MEQIQMTLDQLHQNVVQLTGALNAQIEHMRVNDVRLLRLEEARSHSPAPQLEENPITLNEADLESIRKLPDSVRDLRIFNGNPTEYVSWVHNVESILADYQIVRTKPIYRAVLKHIRQKIRGSADNALVSYNIFDDSWPNIKKCLSLHYGDKRDIQSLENQLHLLRQGRDSLDQFYSKVNHQLSLIINKIKTDEYSADGMKVLIENYRHRALDVFIGGLGQNLAHLIKVQKPQNLPEAYTACLELQNMDFRKSMTYSDTNQYRPTPTNYKPSPTTRQDSDNRQFPRITKPYIPVNNQQTRQFPTYNAPPPRPTQPKPPVPMDVDKTIQTARIDYMNRPNLIVRRSNESSNIPPKNPRIFNLETGDEQEQLQVEEMACADEEEYLTQFEEECGEVNFMTGASPEFPS